MRTISEERFIATKALIQFEDGPLSLCIPRGATLGDVSEKLHNICKWHRGGAPVHRGRLRPQSLEFWRQGLPEQDHRRIRAEVPDGGPTGRRARQRRRPGNGHGLERSRQSASETRVRTREIRIRGGENASSGDARQHGRGPAQAGDASLAGRRGRAGTAAKRAAACGRAAWSGGGTATAARGAPIHGAAEDARGRGANRSALVKRWLRHPRGTASVAVA